MKYGKGVLHRQLSIKLSRKQLLKPIMRFVATSYIDCNVMMIMILKWPRQ